MVTTVGNGILWIFFFLLFIFYHNFNPKWSGKSSKFIRLCWLTAWIFWKKTKKKLFFIKLKNFITVCLHASIIKAYNHSGLFFSCFAQCLTQRRMFDGFLELSCSPKEDSNSSSRWTCIGPLGQKLNQSQNKIVWCVC